MKERSGQCQSLTRRARIAIFVSFSGTGGVERMIMNLTAGLIDRGVNVDVIPVREKSAHLGSLHSAARMVDLESSHTLSSLPGLVRYLRAEKPDALLAAKDRANVIAVLARRIAGVSTRVVLRMGTTVSGALAGRRPLKEHLWYFRMKMLYPLADAVVAVSSGVAKDLEKNAGLSSALVTVIPNPVITTDLVALSEEPIEHPWYRDAGPPVILGVGRLTRQKDFPTLLRAFAAVRKSRSCRLIILGEGRDRSNLESLAKRLGIQEHVSLPGFARNPYPYMKRAAAFILSSLWEGSPNVLTEALALGTPVVSTDCPSGPREVLDHGRFGPLVPMGNPDTLAHAILTVLNAPPEKSLLKSAVAAYTVQESSRKYLDLLLGKGD